MWLQNSLQRTVYESNLIARADRILIAVSGGPDSVGLLHILCDLREEMALHLEAAHVEHGIRGQESKDDARFVHELCERLNLPVHLKEVDIRSMRSRASRGNVEALARHERYRFFVEVARGRDLSKIATAHTQDDQAETVLMWLLRGAGKKGLGGMAARQVINLEAAESSKEMTIIRPLLGVSKADILSLLKERNIECRFDRTNEDSTYLRNWLRLQLMTQLTERIDPRLPSRLAHLAEIMRDEEEFLDALAQKEFAGMDANSWLSRERLMGQPKAMRRRLLRCWLMKARGHLRGIDFNHVESLLGLVGAGPAEGRISIPGGWELIKEYDRLRLRRANRKSDPVCYSYPFVIGQELEIAEAGMTIQSRPSSSPPLELPGNNWEAIFDATSLTGSLTIRNFRPGDRFEPLGMPGHKKKIKELFIDNKIPLSARAVWPILVMGDEILWLPGYGRSEVGKIGPASRGFLRVNAQPSVADRRTSC